MEPVRAALVLLFLAACHGDTGSGPDAMAPMQRAVVRFIQGGFGAHVNGTDTVPTLQTRICVSCPDCASTKLTGSVGGSSLEGLSMWQPACDSGQLEAMASGAGGTTATIAGDVPSDGTITVTFPPGLLDGRQIGTLQPPGPLCPGRSYTMTWSPATDLHGGSAQFTWAQPRFCGTPSGCEGNVPLSMAIPVTIDTVLHVDITSVSTRITAPTSGVITGTVFAMPEEGTATCDAASCTYRVAHLAQLGAEVSPTCP